MRKSGWPAGTGTLLDDNARNFNAISAEVNDYTRRLLDDSASTLGQIASRISQGVRTSANEVYVLDVVRDDGSFLVAYSTQLDREVKLESAAVRRFLHGREIKPFSVQPSGKVLLMPYKILNGSAALIPESELRQHWPRAFEYLQANKHELRAREEGRFSGPTWFEFGRNQNIDLMLLPKILVPDIAEHASFATTARR